MGLLIIGQIAILIGLVQLLRETEKPFLASGIYAFLVFIIGILASSGPLSELIGVLLVLTVIRFILASIYFWLLNKFLESGIIWWIILIGGLLIGLI